MADKDSSRSGVRSAGYSSGQQYGPGFSGLTRSAERWRDSAREQNKTRARCSERSAPSAEATRPRARSGVLSVWLQYGARIWSVNSSGPKFSWPWMPVPV
ncbi:hypothetical protein GGTG_13489 [Gaeumannomyces tritici R3-111a-1]|uniref:Uncharacterized protein n=1 Tax=Gaeumannomyces tritici (strain R3-111a-1) TaxID=644352 RepID=J3PJ07_GAET3|nr:hypothetical protein GGTG_13489 [Gaeumannomyces tritici R3-111a-1]EJT68983.1 hypothetical protein GGTG_13489 [Gaeumannomyces tritici R3-111a-1]